MNSYIHRLRSIVVFLMRSNNNNNDNNYSVCSDIVDYSLQCGEVLRDEQGHFSSVVVFVVFKQSYCRTASYGDIQQVFALCWSFVSVVGLENV